MQERVGDKSGAQGTICDAGQVLELLFSLYSSLPSNLVFIFVSHPPLLRELYAVLRTEPNSTACKSHSLIHCAISSPKSPFYEWWIVGWGYLNRRKGHGCPCMDFLCNRTGWQRMCSHPGVPRKDVGNTFPPPAVWNATGRCMKVMHVEKDVPL